MIEFFNEYPWLALPITVGTYSFVAWLYVLLCKACYKFDRWLRG